VYGTTWKALLQEEFGDGIMSAIDFDMAIERLPDPKARACVRACMHVLRASVTARGVTPLALHRATA
jgi:cyanate lyase